MYRGVDNEIRVGRERACSVRAARCRRRRGRGFSDKGTCHVAVYRIYRKTNEHK